MKDNCNPVFDETFEYIISLGDLNTRQLEVSVVTKKTWFSSQSPVMGQVCKTVCVLILSFINCSNRLNFEFTLFCVLQNDDIFTFILQVILSLGEMDLVKGFTAWYDLLPEIDRDS